MPPPKRDHAWKEQGACHGQDPDIFFPHPGDSHAQAQAICSTCPVFDRCYEAGLYEHFGVWAGMSERERRRLRRRLGIRLDFDEPSTEPPDDDLEVA